MLGNVITDVDETGRNRNDAQEKDAENAKGSTSDQRQDFKENGNEKVTCTLN